MASPPTPRLQVGTGTDLELQVEDTGASSAAFPAHALRQVHSSSPTTLSTVTNAVPMRRHRKASIESLPVELFVAIFREVIRHSKFNEWNPSTLASVSSFWRRIAFLTPEFWTRLTIFIDKPFFSTSSITAAFARSCNLNLERVVVTRKTWTPKHDEHERERVMSIMQIINSQIRRCRAISFNVLSSSSLPSFPGDFHGTAEHLTSLKLRCREDDGGAPADANEMRLSSVHHEPFQCPNLDELAIDGRNYFNACQRNVHWTEMFSAISTLSISHFTPVTIRSESFTSSQLMLSVFPFQDHLKTLSIDDVHLDESPNPILDELNDFLDLEMLALTNMHNNRCLTQITDFFGWSQNVHIARCPLDPEYCFGGSLSLKEIDGGEDLVKSLRDCISNELVIDDCPGFGDAFLQAMTIPEPGPGPWPFSPSHCVPDVQRLSIHNCSGFSVSALKQMVQTRCLRHYYPLEFLRLSGRVPDLSSEDREWFEGFLSNFSYNPIQ